MARKPLDRLLVVVGVAAVLLGSLVIWFWLDAEPDSGPTADSAAPTTSETGLNGNEAKDVESSGRSQPNASKADRTKADPDTREVVRSETLSRLVIPSLGVNAPMLEIGMVDRTLVPPDDPDTVGWWRGGPAPGAPKGSALIIGHTKRVPGVTGTGDGALGNISKLRTGDHIEVRMRADEPVDYEVTDIVPAKDYDQVAADAGTIDDRDYPGGRLVLITCWSNGSTFTGNTFVFAEPA